MIIDPITYYRSTTFPLTVTVTPPDGLTANTALFTVKTDQYDDDASDTDAIVKKTISGVGNVFTTSIDPSDIADSVDPGTYYYSIHIVLSDGTIAPFADGKFYLKADPTNRES